MKRNYIILIIIIIALVVVGFWLFGSQETEELSDMTKQDLNELMEDIDNQEMINNQPMAEGDSLNNSYNLSGQLKEFTLEASNFQYNLKEIRVNKGDTVKITLTNSRGFHDLVIDEFDVRTDQLEAGQESTIEFVADRSGEFEYYCDIGNHRQMGMIGKLIVE
ncbi:MAG: hypothetical protein COU22_00490 [Candidatus Komeilibacteria bacterium CG10_big_fil_rev_8_21_14_0_10_41_13]|uniref:EfeO-type cupredoxin-like domain-containing protein n=1 Tax=Candidatus Komeilibacteria bacterium CG10_big_fil_rev_8_21_14_0_10_41_13 TaxID=1974476 RepID=A0A2M6WD85_9BACT|nr:MAG: hypothetical protein COU22_00490 [Candidatus Komeilibacteria bacterium CG10_big_fil_rev_8_21_14_0_10_41_13]